MIIKRAALLRAAVEPQDLNALAGLPNDALAWVFQIFRHEAAIDEDGFARAIEPQRREDPIATVGREAWHLGSRRKYVALARMVENAAQTQGLIFARVSQAGIFEVMTGQARPNCGGRSWGGGSARFQRGENVFLPHLTVPLPGAKPQQDCDAENAQQCG